MFGRDFTDQLLALEPGRWEGPVSSGYGLHVVFVHERRERRRPGLTEVRDRVLNDWRREHREQISEATYQRLRERYEVSIEWSPEAAS
jgi:parvulin-like peptidyl-prolyl isomerase